MAKVAGEDGQPVRLSRCGDNQVLELNDRGSRQLCNPSDPERNGPVKDQKSVPKVHFNGLPESLIRVSTLTFPFTPKFQDSCLKLNQGYDAEPKVRTVAAHPSN